MSYGVESIRIHKKLRLDKRAGSDNWYARLTLPNGKRLVKTTKTDDLEAAKEVALRLYYEVDARIQNKLNCYKLATQVSQGFGYGQGIKRITINAQIGYL